MSRVLTPVGYHCELRDALRELEPGLWEWFASDDFESKSVDLIRLELLKSTYRMQASVHGELHALAREVAEQLEIDASLSLYQAQDAGVMNAGLYFVSGEIHLVFTGPVLKVLEPLELKALLGHELAHYRLWTVEGGTFRVTNELVEYMAAQAGAADSHVQSALRNRRWVELYADRGSLAVTGSLQAAVGCLLKVGTGLTSADPDSYLAQAEEVLLADKKPTKEHTHPESFIRAFALKSWSEKGDEAEAAIRDLVEGPLEVGSLDLMQQRALTAETRRLIDRVLAQPWFRTDANLGHARRFFPEYQPVAPVEARADLRVAEEYLAYVLLDFAVVDEELDRVGLAHVSGVAEEVGLGDAFEKLARKELKLTVKAYREMRAGAAELVQKAAAEAAES